MLHPRQGALRKIKALLISKGLEIRGWCLRRWSSISFEGWLFRILVVPPADDALELDTKLQDITIEFFGFLLADMCFAGEEHCSDQNCLVIGALLVDDRT